MASLHMYSQAGPATVPSVPKALGVYAKEAIYGFANGRIEVVGIVRESDHKLGGCRRAQSCGLQGKSIGRLDLQAGCGRGLHGDGKHPRDAASSKPDAARAFKRNGVDVEDAQAEPAQIRAGLKRESDGSAAETRETDCLDRVRENRARARVDVGQANASGQADIGSPVGWVIANVIVVDRARGETPSIDGGGIDIG
jgi:hypothetical protein